MKVFTTEGKHVTLEFSDELTCPTLGTAVYDVYGADRTDVEGAFDLGDIVEYTLDSDGYVASLERLGEFPSGDTVAATAISEKNDTLTIESVKYRPTSSSAFFLIDTDTSLPWKAMGWDAFEHYSRRR